MTLSPECASPSSEERDYESKYEQCSPRQRGGGPARFLFLWKQAGKKLSWDVYTRKVSVILCQIYSLR